MTTDWCPGAERIHIGDGAGTMAGGQPRCTHHTTEGGTIEGAIATYRQTHYYPTITADYVHDRVVQHLPATIAATALQNAAGGVQTNKQGRVNIQIEWVGHAADPFTAKRAHAGPNVRALLDWIRSHGIPAVWPAGAPLPYPDSYGDNGQRSTTAWAKAGHFGHSQVPENHHGDPGAINPAFVKQTATAPAPAPTSTPTPAPTPKEKTVHLIQVKGDPAVYVTDWVHKRHVTNQAELQAIVASGVSSKVQVVTQAILDALPVAS